jgi:hypothetical protein
VVPWWEAVGVAYQPSPSVAGSSLPPLSRPQLAEAVVFGQSSCERTGLPISVGISAANLHDSQALIPLMKGIPPIRSRRGRRRRKPGKLHGDKATTTPTCGDGYASVASPTASPARASSPRSDWADTAGPSNALWPGSPAAAGSTAATNAKPFTSSPSRASPAPSSATADSRPGRSCAGAQVLAAP